MNDVSNLAMTNLKSDIMKNKFGKLNNNNLNKNQGINSKKDEIPILNINEYISNNKTPNIKESILKSSNEKNGKNDVNYNTGRKSIRSLNISFINLSF